jgi:hypothetical protein
MFLFFTVLAVLAVLPMLAAEVPPLVDYPNHLARQYILNPVPDDAHILKNYIVDWRPIPNLAMDLIVYPLAQILPIALAGKLFLILCLVAVTGGIFTLYRVVHGRLDYWPAVSFLVIYNLPLAWGFVNFYFSVGIFLFVFAGWIATQHWHSGAKLLCLNLALGFLYLCHLFGFLACIAAIGLFELRLTVLAGDFRIKTLARRSVPVLGQLCLPVLIFTAGKLFWQSDVVPLELGTWFGTLGMKASVLLSGFFFYGGLADVLPILFFVTAIAMAGLRRQLEISNTLLWPFMLFLLLALVSPHVFRGLFLDSRLAFIFICLTITAINIQIPKGFTRMAFATILIAIFSLKMGTTHRIWAAYEGKYAEFRSALNVVTPGSRMLSVHDSMSRGKLLRYDVEWWMGGIVLGPGLYPGFAFRHLPTLAVIDRGVFMPSVFTYPSAQPISSSAQHLHIDPIQPPRTITYAPLPGRPVVDAKNCFGWTGRRSSITYS